MSAPATAERPSQALAAALGLAPDARLAVAHQDDVGMCHGANRAFAELAGKGFITCGSVMVPCPWFRELADLAAADPNLDVGVHLTLTSEWEHYRWRPLTGVSKASGLVDDDGFMWRRVPMLREHVVAEAAEAELRAQIDAALASGLDVTHLDAHMGAVLAPELIDVYMALGRAYDLPVLLPRDPAGYLGALKMGPLDPAILADRARKAEAAGLPLFDHFGMTPGVETAKVRQAYEGLVEAAPAGLSFLAFHCNAPGDIETIVPPRAQWRIDEYDLFRDPGFLAWVAGRDIRLIGFRPIRDWWRRQRRAP